MFPGGGKQMQDLQKKMQKMQEDMMKTQQQLEQTVWKATSGGGMVTVEMNGRYDLQSLKISKEVVDPDDIEMLEDLIVSAIREAHNIVSKEVEAGMSKFTGGLKIPGLF